MLRPDAIRRPFSILGGRCVAPSGLFVYPTLPRAAPWAVAIRPRWGHCRYATLTHSHLGLLGLSSPNHSLTHTTNKARHASLHAGPSPSTLRFPRVHPVTPGPYFDAIRELFPITRCANALPAISGNDTRPSDAALHVPDSCITCSRLLNRGMSSGN